MQPLKKINMEELIIQDTPQEVTNHDKKTSAFSLEAIDAWLIKQQKITTKQKVIFFRLLATMVNAGLPMLKSLTILQKQEPNPILQNIYTTIIDQIK